MEIAMDENTLSTLERIQQAALDEFSEKGFLGASLRQIVKNAGVTTGCVHWMVDYICRHREPVKLLLSRSEGTSYEHFVHNMVEVEVEYTLKYMDVLRRLGREIPELDEQMCHIIASGMFNGIFEIVIHDMPEGRALRYVDQLRDFYTAGWLKLMGP